MGHPLTTTEHEPRKCPHCGYVMNATTGLGIPEPGDFGICERCAAILLLDTDLRFRPVTQEDLDAQPTEILFYLVSLARMVRQRNASERAARN